MKKHNCGPCAKKDKCDCPPGPKGDRGAPGTPGTPGATGEPGPTGECECPESPAVSVTGEPQLIATDTEEALIFSAPPIFDDLAAPMWNASDPTRLTAQEAGRYQVTGNVRWDANAFGEFRNLGIRKSNGTYVTLSKVNPTASSGVSGGGPQQIVTGLVNLEVGEYVELVVEQNSGGPLSTAKPAAPFDETSPAFMMHKV